MKNNLRGASLITVVVTISVAAIAASSVVSLMMTQRRLALRKELEMHAVNAAESAIDYGYSVLINKVGTAGDFGISEIPTTGYSTLSLPLTGTNFLSGVVSLPSGTFTGKTGSVVLKDATIRVLPVSASPTRRYVDPADPANDDDPNRGQWVWDTEVPLVAKVTAEQGGQAYTAYLKKSVVGRRVPMFQHAIFFQGQLQLHRSYRIVGPVHTNGTMLLNAQNGDTSVYAGGMTSSGHFYRGSSNDAGGTGIDAFGYTPVDIYGDLDFSTSVSPRVNLSATGNNRISIYVENQGTTATPNYVTKYANPGFDSLMSDWQTQALRTFKGNLQDKSHQVPTFTPQGSVGYRQDVPATSTINEFSNGTYSLIEPLLPAGHASRKTDTSRANKLAARASLILRVERNNQFIPEVSPGSPYNYQFSNPGGGAHPYNVLGVNRYYYSGSGGSKVFFTTANEWRASNRNERFVVKGYKYLIPPSSGVEPTYSPVRLPDRMIGTANNAMTAVNSGEPFAENTEYSGSGSSTDVTQGLHDARFGRSVEPFTLDMARFKAVLEGTAGDATAVAFRTDFSPTLDWNGVMYMEMPTSLTPDSSALPNLTQTAGVLISTQPYSYGAAELRHPDRWSDSDHLSRPDRTDRIVPFAPELRGYPPGSVSEAEMKSPEFAIPALQIINAEDLPNPTGSPGLTLATNLPVYLQGSYNCDGNVFTNTNLTSNSPTAYGSRDTGEVSAAIFCDTLTVLSEQWRTSNREKGFNGWNGAAGTRPVSSRIEIAACIATGEYPVFEFFTHALESFQSLYNSNPPIVFKGSVIGMFKSEVQHIKRAYGRNQNNQIEDYWNNHGAFAIPSVRFHQDLVSGTFPPGIPMALVFRPSDHRFLRSGNTDDKAIMTKVGF